MTNKKLIKSVSGALLSALLFTSASFLELSAAPASSKDSVTTKMDTKTGTKGAKQAQKPGKKKRRVRRVVRRRRKSKVPAKKGQGHVRPGKVVVRKPGSKIQDKTKAINK